MAPRLAEGYPRVGIVGGGQLARMMQQAAIPLGIGVRVLALDAAESAAQVARDVAIGRHDDLDALLAFSEGLDVVTFDHEHVPPAYLEQLEARGIAVRPGPTSLVHAQDKAIMRTRLDAAGIPCPAWTVIADAADGVAFGDRVGWPFILKTSRGGYDGKGVWKIADGEQLAEVMESVALGPHAVWLAEELVHFTQELAAQVARSPQGQVVAYPVVRTVQTDGICTEVVAPAPGLAPERAIEAQRIAITIANAAKRRFDENHFSPLMTHSSPSSSARHAMLVASEDETSGSVIAYALREAGMEVIYTGIRRTAEEIVRTAIAEDVAMIGLSILAGAHMQLTARVLELLQKNKIEDIKVILGGLIPPKAADQLKNKIPNPFGR